MALLLLLAVYVVSFTATEMRISTSQSAATKTYYLAESGIAEAIWRLKNDSAWKTGFETNPAWTFTYTRQPALYTDGSYQIHIVNSGLARGTITATGFLTTGDSTAQRVIQTTVYKALGDSPVGDNGEYADGNIDISGSLINVYNGSLFSNNNLIVNFWSTVNVDNVVAARGNILKHWTSTINAAAQEEGADPLPMPAVSFDNPSDPDSYLNRATAVYTQNQFENLLWNNQNLILPGPITYVSGNIAIKGGQNLTVTGVLVASGNIEVGKNTLLCCWGLRCGRSNLTINQAAGNAPAGLLSKGKINFELCLNNFNASGLIYANDQINVLSLPGTFNVTGGLISRKLTLTSIWQGINITFDNDIISYALGDPLFSPVVTVEHWEEEY